MRARSRRADPKAQTAAFPAMETTPPRHRRLQTARPRPRGRVRAQHRPTPGPAARPLLGEIHATDVRYERLPRSSRDADLRRIGGTVVLDRGVRRRLSCPRHAGLRPRWSRRRRRPCRPAGESGPATAIGASCAVVANDELQRAVVDDGPDVCAPGAGMLDHARQRFGDDEVGVVSTVAAAAARCGRRRGRARRCRGRGIRLPPAGHRGGARPA